MTKIDQCNEIIIIILAMVECIIFLSHMNNGKSTIAERILAGNLKVCETVDTDIKRKKNTTV